MVLDMVLEDVTELYGLPSLLVSRESAVVSDRDGLGQRLQWITYEAAEDLAEWKQYLHGNICPVGGRQCG